MRASIHSYATGFLLSIILTLVPFYIVINHVASGWTLVITLLICAIAQLLVQLQFFIHLGHESGPRWNVLIFLFMALVLLIVVIGSLWIMKNLNYHTMSQHETEMYIQDEEAIHR